VPSVGDQQLAAPVKGCAGTAVGWTLPGMPTHGTDTPVAGTLGANGDVDVPLDGDIAEVMKGDVVANGDGVSNGVSDVVIDVVGGSGLKPPGASSAEPMGIPTRPTAARLPIPVGDDADAATFDEPLPPVAQVPDAVPVMPPPSKSVVELDPPVVMSGEPPQAELPPVMALCGSMPGNAALTPGVESSVAPNGIPTGPTDAAGPMPSGDVIPSGGSVACASAGCALASAATAARIARCFTADSITVRRNVLTRGCADNRSGSGR
jgi:hypothetical protein